MSSGELLVSEGSVKSVKLAGLRSFFLELHTHCPGSPRLLY